MACSAAARGAASSDRSDGPPVARSRSAAGGSRVEAATNKVGRLQAELEDVEAELAEELTEIDARWMGLAKNVATVPVTLERTDVKVTHLALAWIPTT